MAKDSRMDNALQVIQHMNAGMTVVEACLEGIITAIQYVPFSPYIHLW